jgi:hypothetical protein
MLIVVVCCALLVGLTTAIHYEVLRVLNRSLPSISIPGRRKLLVVVFATLVAHGLEIGVYGGALYLLARYADVGGFSGPLPLSWLNCLIFSAETYTSLGFGDFIPVGPLRLIAGVEALNGLLMIGWSASYTYIAMERFWRDGSPGQRR